MSSTTPANYLEPRSLEARLAAAEAEIATVRKALAEQEAEDNSPAAKAARLPVPYEPAGGRWFIHTLFAGSAEFSSSEAYRTIGYEYPTREAAEASRVRLLAYAKLLHLAADLNPSGKAGGSWCVCWNEDRPGELEACWGRSRAVPASTPFSRPRKPRSRPPRS